MPECIRYSKSGTPPPFFFPPLPNAKTAATELAQIEEALEREFTKAESIQVTGSPVPLIIEQAQRVSADYIVIGSHGHTAFYDLLVGSTASGILKRAPCPVVIVPSGKKKTANAHY